MEYHEYASTAPLDDIRRAEYGFLDEQHHVYLDYTGAGLASCAQHRAHAHRQSSTVLGNPHSASPTSEAATQLVEHARSRVLQHLNANPDEYVAIFTANATGAARLVGESYRFRPDARLVLTADNHNSVHGLREFARRADTETVYVPSMSPSLAVDRAALDAALRPRSVWLTGWTKWAKNLGLSSCWGGDGGDDDDDDGETREKDVYDHPSHSGLFAYPAQSNFSGVRHPLAWVADAQARGFDVLLDAAAYLSTGSLDLSLTHPDFVLVSWYKLFGFPTGVGCLVARRAALARLDRPWFSGGTIRAVSVGLDWHAPARDVAARFEDGTLNFQAIPDVAVGLDWLEDGVGMERLQTRVRCLTASFLRRLVALKHANGQPMAVLYGPGPDSQTARGPTVTFNLIDCLGRVIDERIVATDAAAVRISLRTGCFCNPGAGETALGLTRDDLRRLQQMAVRSLAGPSGHGHASSIRTAHSDDSVAAEKKRQRLQKASASTTPLSSTEPLPLAGAVRVSFGVASNTADLDYFFDFVQNAYRDRFVDSSHLGPRMEC